jgi:RNA polymerase sigma-70 factor, ECF subfamily
MAIPRYGRVLMSESCSQRSDQIMQLLTGVQQQLTRYVRSLVPHRADAEEVLQETNLFIWRRSDEYELGTNFAAWACKIAYFQVLSYRKRQTRGRLRFSDALVDQLAAGAGPRDDWAGEEVEVFETCMAKLSLQDRELIELRYEPDATVDRIAQRLGRSTKTIYNTLGRIRAWLLECISTAISERRKT